MLESRGNGDISGPPFDTLEDLEGPPLQTRRIMQAALILAAIVTVVVLVSIARGAYTNTLWFSELGLRSVYTNVFFTRIWLFVAGFLAMGGLSALSLWLAYRYSWGPVKVDIPPQAIGWIRRLLLASMVGTVIIAAVSFGAALSSRWLEFLQFMNAVPFQMQDPLFHHDVGFYVFNLPMFHVLQGWTMGAVLTLLIISASVYGLTYGLRGIGPFLEPGPRVHLTILASAFMFCIAWAHFLDIYETVLSQSGVIAGASATDVAARIPMLRLLTGVAALSGVIMLVSVRMASIQQAFRTIGAAFGLWAVAALIGGLIVPALYQRFSVAPSELERERPYIERNIEWTRYGFDLDRVIERSFDVRDEALAADLVDNPESVNNIRLWDPRPLLDVYNQIQHLRTYYQFLDIDIDRYVVDDEYRQVLISARELFPQGLDASAQNWVSRKLVYTHGYGLVMSPTRDFTPEGQPLLFIQDVPPKGKFEVHQPRIYYGEQADDFVIVNSTEAEFDRPPPQASDQPVYIQRYDGAGGVALSNWLRRAAYAWELADINILISGQLTPESRVLYRRAVRERIATVAPFLRLDRDPYIVVHDGRLFWIQDAYTVTDRLPYSRRLENRDFNYIRNSVKVVLDAYNGDLAFYTIEPARPDPVLRMYKSIFPALFRPISEMPAGLRDHIRYPEVLLRAQANVFLQYHMNDPKEFFLKEDQWAIPNEVFLTSNVQPVDPYYVIMKLPEEEDTEFVMILPFTPREKENMLAWIAARSDGDHYGDLLLYQFPTDRLFNGPNQIEARIDNDPAISEQFTLWSQSGSLVIRGNLLVLPIGETLLYAEPIYLQAERLAFPELKRVILASADRIVMEPTLQEAVIALVSGRESAPAPGDGGPAPGGVLSERLRTELEQLREAMESLQGGLTALDESLQDLEDLAGEEKP